MTLNARMAVVGIAALVGSALIAPDATRAGGGRGQVPATATCPADPLYFGLVDAETCAATVPDLTGEVAISAGDLAGAICIKVEQSPPAGTQVGAGTHDITLTVTGCFIVAALGNDNTGGGGPPCDGLDCFEIETCLLQFQALSEPELVCDSGGLEPVTLTGDCEIIIPDVVAAGAVIVMDCAAGVFDIQQDPPAGTVVTAAGGSFFIRVFVDELEQECFLELPVSPVTQCPVEVRLDADESCTAVLPALCDAYLPACTTFPEALGASAVSYTCRTEPPAGTALPVGEHTVSIIVEACTVLVVGLGTEEDCEERPDLSCSVNVTVSAPFPIVECPTTQPAIEPLTLTADCAVVVPDLRDLLTIDGCPGSEVELFQFPEPGLEVRVSSEFLYVDVYRGGKTPPCEFMVPVNHIVSCPDTPQSVVLDENCEAVVPDLTGDVAVADCCAASARGIFDCEIRITQSPAAGSPLTGPTDVTIEVERCFTFPDVLAIGAGSDESCEALGSCTVQLNPVDETPPVIANCPEDLVLGADADCLGLVPDLTIPDVTTIAIATDNCTAAEDIILTQSPAAGTQIGLGTTVVTVTATDAAGNAASCSVTIDLEANGCDSPPAGQPEPPKVEDPIVEQPVVPPCDPANQSLNLLFSLLFHSPVCGAACPITVSMTICGFFAMKRTLRRRRRS